MAEFPVGLGEGDGRVRLDDADGLLDAEAAPDVGEFEFALGGEVFRLLKLLLGEGADGAAGGGDVFGRGAGLELDDEFAGLIERYLAGYMDWLAAAPEIAIWADIALIVSASEGARTLDQEPDAILISPFHPLRLA